MKLFVAILFVASATAEPPISAEAAGGSATVLATPFKLLPSNRFATPTPSPAALYNAPSRSISSPTTFYGVPVASSNFAGAVSTPIGLTGVTVAAYSGPVYPPIPILRLNSETNGDGSYRFEYETANHIAAQESGHQKTPDSSEVQGAYSYLAPNGQTISVSYTADENGFRPAGEHLPTPPPIPAAILKSLEINAAEEARGIIDDGQYRPAAGELVVAQQYGAPSVSSQYLPPVTQGGYKY